MNYYKYNTPYSAQEKLKALMLWKRSTTEFVCHRYHCSARSLRRWRQIYDGTIESLQNTSHRPLTPHPNSQTEEEKMHINNLVKRNPTIGLNELYGKLRVKYNYKRNPVTLYRYLQKMGFYLQRGKRKAYVPKPYDTPQKIGMKWQMDVKYVPFECKSTLISGQCRYYQYTMIDEATRQRFIYPYEELSAMNTVDFVKRAIMFFKYRPKIIQTDNGIEFTYTRQTTHDKVHPLDKFCQCNNIQHKLIKPRTPRHNGKVERSHRTDNERFYKFLKFYSYEDLLKQMMAYLKRWNNIPISTLKSRDGKERWLTPNQKRAELLYLDYGIEE